jgi:hypothetical protein
VGSHQARLIFWVLVQNVLPRNVLRQNDLPHNILLFKMSFLQNVHRYKTSMDTKRPPLQNVQSAKRPETQNVHGYKTSFSTKTSIDIKRPSLLLFFLQIITSSRHGKSAGFVPFFHRFIHKSAIQGQDGHKSIAEILHGKSAGLVPFFADITMSNASLVL